MARISGLTQSMDSFVADLGNRSDGEFGWGGTPAIQKRWRP